MPFCPQCRFEYEAGIETCPECDEPLVAELPAEEGTERPEAAAEPAWQELVTVYSAMEYGEAVLVETLLQGSDIPAFLVNEQSGLTMAAPLDSGWFQVRVPPEYEENARAILEEAEHLAERSDAPAVAQAEEMDFPEVDDDGEV